MLSGNHTYFSDPHIHDPIQWLEGGDDPVLLQEEFRYAATRHWTEGLQLLFGAFILMLIVTTSTSNAPKKPRDILQKTAALAVERIDDFPASKVSQPELSAEAYAVGIIGSTKILMHQREWKTLAPASLTKLLTAVLALEYLPKNSIITITKHAKSVGEKMSKVPLGEQFLRDEAIRMVLIESDNDIAEAMAETIEKQRAETFEENLPEFMKLMNDKATKIGMQFSYFKNPTGLDVEGHSVSAEDFLKLINYIWNTHPEIWEDTTMSTATITSLASHSYIISNTNDLLKEFPALRGGKTGFTEHAKGALILLYPVRPAYTAAVIILGSLDRFGDGRKVIQWLEEAF